MKRTLQLIVFVAIAGALMTYSSCKGKKDNPVPATDTQIDKLSKAWKVTTVTLDGSDQTAAYADFEITFSGTHGQTTVNYTTTGRPALSAWPASGNFTFNSTNPQTLMTRNDATAVPFSYSVADTQLQMNFTYNGAGFTAKTGEVKGAWIFIMQPK